MSYKETQANAKIDPTSAWTGTWRDPRFPQAGGNKPENALIGQLWMVNCCADRIRVPASMAGLRFWRNTAVADLAPGDTVGYRTSAESLGYEWDEVIDNGSTAIAVAAEPTLGDFGFTLISLAAMLALFDEILAITQGGPGNDTWVAAWYTYRRAFQPPFDIGLGAASAWILAIMVGLIA